jgi:hypothetical protein
MVGIARKSSQAELINASGFGQSGDEFQIKTKKLRTFLSRTLSPALLSRYPDGITFSYPTGPLELPMTDTNDTSLGTDVESKYAWWRTLEVISEYKEFPSAIAYLSNYIAREGPFDGVVGFSQGAALAAIVASWCEAPWVPERSSALATQDIPVTIKAPQRPLKFAICYSGYRATPRYYGGFYSPRIQTPVFSVTGDWDHMVNTTRSQELKESCSNIEIMSHPGTHYVPIGDKYLEPVGDFINRVLMSQCEESSNEFNAALCSSNLNHRALPRKAASINSPVLRPRVRCISRKSYRVYLGRSDVAYKRVAYASELAQSHRNSI